MNGQWQVSLDGSVTWKEGPKRPEYTLEEMTREYWRVVGRILPMDEPVPVGLKWVSNLALNIHEGAVHRLRKAEEDKKAAEGALLEAQAKVTELSNDVARLRDANYELDCERIRLENALKDSREARKHEDRIIKDQQRKINALSDALNRDPSGKRYKPLACENCGSKIHFSWERDGQRWYGCTSCGLFQPRDASKVRKVRK